jgi:ankyrin repeat protein
VTRHGIRPVILLLLAFGLACVAAWRNWQYHRQVRLDWLGGELHESVERGDIESVEHLLEQGAPVDSEIRWIEMYDYICPDFSTGHVRVAGPPIDRAIMNNDTQIIHSLLRYGSDVDRLDAALDHADNDTLTFLVSHGMDVTAGSTILRASDRGPEIIRLFLDHGADPNAVCYNGVPVLQEARRLGCTSAVAVLIEYGAITNKP